MMTAEEKLRQLARTGNREAKRTKFNRGRIREKQKATEDLNEQQRKLRKETKPK